MKRKWAGSQTRPSAWHASTQDRPSWETSRRRELSGGHAGGGVTSAVQPRAVELARGTNSGPGLAAGLERLASGNAGSGVQKSCEGKGHRG